MASAAASFCNDLIGDFTMDATSKTKTATLTVGNKTYYFPILSGTVGPDVIDIAKLYAQSGMFTFWGTMLLGPRLIMDPAASPSLGRSFIRFFVTFSAIYVLVAAIIPRNHGGVFFGFIIFAAGSTWLNYFYIKYFKLLNANQPIAQPLAAKAEEGFSGETKSAKPDHGLPLRQ